MNSPPHTKPALIVIDVQQALCFGEHAAYQSERVIERINRVSRKTRAAGAPVLFVQHESTADSLVYGSAGWQLAAGLETRDGDLYIRKSGSDSFHQTELAAVLERSGIGRLVVCGLQSEFCVDSTVRRALALGYPVILVSDAHSTVDSGLLCAAQIIAHHNLTLGNLCSYGPRAKPCPADAVLFDASTDPTAD